MPRIILARLSGVCLAAALMFGTVAALEQPSNAQVTLKCWKEACVTHPKSGEAVCIREEIPCPSVT